METQVSLSARQKISKVNTYEKRGKRVSFSAFCIVKGNPSNTLIVCWSDTTGKSFVIDWRLLAAQKKSHAKAATPGELRCGAQGLEAAPAGLSLTEALVGHV